MPQTTEDFRKLFNRKLLEFLASQKGRTSGLLSPERFFNYIVGRLHELWRHRRNLLKTTGWQISLFSSKQRSVRNPRRISEGSGHSEIPCQYGPYIWCDTHTASTHWTRRARHHQRKVEGDPRQHHEGGHPAVRGFMWDVRLEEEKSPEKSCCEANSVSNLLNSRCQVDLVDMQSQPDGCFKWICIPRSPNEVPTSTWSSVPTRQSKLLRLLKHYRTFSVCLALQTSCNQTMVESSPTK